MIDMVHCCVVQLHRCVVQCCIVALLHDCVFCTLMSAPEDESQNFITMIQSKFQLMITVTVVPPPSDPVSARHCVRPRSLVGQAIVEGLPPCPPAPAGLACHSTDVGRLVLCCMRRSRSVVRCAATPRARTARHGTGPARHGAGPARTALGRSVGGRTSSGNG